MGIPVNLVELLVLKPSDSVPDCCLLWVVSHQEIPVAFCPCGSMWQNGGLHLSGAIDHKQMYSFGCFCKVSGKLFSLSYTVNYTGEIRRKVFYVVKLCEIYVDKNDDQCLILEHGQWK